MIKVTHKERIKMEVVSEINQMKRVFQKHRNILKSDISVVQERICQIILISEIR